MYTSQVFDNIKRILALFFRYVRPMTVLPILSICFLLLGYVTPTQALIIMAGGFVQNFTYTILSLARLGKNEYLHFVMIILSALTFFFTAFFIILKEAPLSFAIFYVFATVCGNLSGKKNKDAIEIRVSKLFKLENIKGKREKENLPPKYLYYTFGITATAECLVYIGFNVFSATPFPHSPLQLALAFIAPLANAYASSALMIARNSDSYRQHLKWILIQMLSVLIYFKLMSDSQGDWFLLIPMIGGNAIGSIIGGRKEKEELIRRKSSFDNHVTEGKKIGTPTKETLWACVLLLTQLPFFWHETTENIPILLLIMGVGLLESAAFAASSRARTRTNMSIIEWACFASNGIFYLRVASLMTGAIPLMFFIPYLASSAIGSLWLQKISMHIEKILGSITGVDLTYKEKLT